ncbi:hypothetical protein [Siminovitchia sp. 179-K 8D1 HS]
MKDFQEEYNVFESALEIPEPWYVFHHELDKDEKTDYSHAIDPVVPSF